MKQLLASVVAGVVSLQVTLAQSPVIASTMPCAVRPGQSTTWTFSGQNLRGATELWTSFPAKIVKETESAEPNANNVAFRLNLLPDTPSGIGAVRLATSNGVSSLHFVPIDHLLCRADNKANHTLETAQAIVPPLAIDGETENLGFNFYRFNAQRGQLISIEAVAQRIGSELDPVLRLLDARGRELAYCDDAPGLGADARLQCPIPETGSYFVEVRDIRYRGGTKLHYHLRVANAALVPLAFLPVRQADFVPASARLWPEQIEVEPNSTPETATPLKLPATVRGRFDQDGDRDFYEFDVQEGERLAFLGQTRTLGSACDLFMRLYKEDQSLVGEANIAGANEGSLTNTFNEAGKYRLMVEELNRQGGSDFNYQIEIQPLSAGFSLSVETDKIEAAAGGTVEIKVTAARRQYAGPITLALLGSARAFDLANPVIPAKTNEIQLKLALPSNLAPGKIVHFGIIGYAKIGDRYFETQAGSMPAIRKLLPTMLFPPLEFDGLIGLGVKEPEKPKTPVAAKSS